MLQKHPTIKISLTQFSLATLRLCGKRYLQLFFFILSISAIAQQNKIATIELNEVVSAYVDRPGDVYIIQKNNTLKKFDSVGNVLYEKKFVATPTVFDPRDGARMFSYQKQTGMISFYSEETKQEFLVEQQYAIEPVLACASGDHHIWLLDRADVSIKKINPSTSKVLAEARIDQNQFNSPAEIVFMREYQHFLFIYIKDSAILIFNSLGIQIKKIPATDIEYFNFFGEELYYKKNDKLIFHDLFDTSIREEAIDPACKFALLTDTRKFLIYSNRIEIFRIL